MGTFAMAVAPERPVRIVHRTSSMPHLLLTRCVLAASMVLVGDPSALAYREVAVSDGGRVVGTVRVVGDVQPLPAQPVYKEQQFCGNDTVDERLVVDGAGGLAGAVIHVEGIEAGRPVPKTEPVRLDNRRCAFVPHVVAASVGQTLEMRNEDPFLHDAHALLGTETLFNLALPKGRTVRHVLDRAGIAHVNCNVRHTWMHAYLFVTDDPYHTVSDGGGRFSLEGVPPGRHTIAVWHELLGSRRREVTVAPNETTTVDFALDARAPETP
jgi:plastocyanin